MSTTGTSGDQDEAVEIAEAIEVVMSGRSTVACYLALGMVIGVSALRSEKPDLPGLLKLLEGIAVDQMRSHVDRGGSLS